MRSSSTRRARGSTRLAATWRGASTTCCTCPAIPRPSRGTWPTCMPRTPSRASPRSTSFPTRRTSRRASSCSAGSDTDVCTRVTCVASIQRVLSCELRVAKKRGTPTEQRGRGMRSKGREWAAGPQCQNPKFESKVAPYPKCSIKVWRVHVHVHGRVACGGWRACWLARSAAWAAAAAGLVAAGLLVCAYRELLCTTFFFCLLCML